MVGIQDEILEKKDQLSMSNAQMTEGIQAYQKYINQFREGTKSIYGFSSQLN